MSDISFCASLCQDSTSGRVRVVDGALVIDEVVPSDGGLYSCMAVSTSGNASRDVAIQSKSSCLCLCCQVKEDLVFTHSIIMRLTYI